MIRHFNLFSEELLLESIVNETYLYFVKDFKDSLYKISTKSQIAKDLIDSEYTDVKPDMTFISLSDKEGYVSFTTLRNLKRNIEKSFREWAKGQNLDDERIKKVLDTMLDKIEKGETSQSDVNFMFKEYDLGTKSRNDSKIGRLVNALLPGKYSDKEIEEFVNLFKASKEISGERFEVVSGKDIEFWYNNENYAEMNGTLGNSCMAQKRNIFNIYVNNPDVCRLLVLLNEDNKLIGRALVWKLEKMNIVKDEDPGFFMDRQYTIKDSDVEKFRDYAKKEGWSYKSYNNHHSFGTVNYKGEDRNVEMTVQVGRIGGDYDYQRYPYMDTFRRYDPRIGKLYNDDDQESEQEGCYILEDTGGGYSEVEGGVWSEWHDRMIPEDEAVYSEPYGDHILRDYAVRVSVGSSRRRGWYHQDDDDVVYDEYSDEYVHVDDAVYSDIYGEWLWDERAVRTITEIYSDGDVENSEGNWCYVNDSDIVRLRDMRNMLWYEKLSDKFSDWDDYEYIYKNIITKDYNGDYIPEILERTIYKVGDPKSSDSPDIFGVEWLLEEDAIALDYEINMDNSRVIDIIQYSKDIEEILQIILNKLNVKIKQLKNILKDEGQIRMKFDDEEEYRKAIHELKTKLTTRFEELDSEEWV